MQSTTRLEIVASATLRVPVLSKSLIYEGRTQLIAFFDAQHSVCISRPNGQITHIITQSTLGSEPSCLEWYDGGSRLKVGAIDGSIYDIETQSGALVAATVTNNDEQSSTAAVACIGSCRSTIAAVTDDSRSSIKTASLVNDFAKLKIENVSPTIALSENLPQQLALIDVAATLPGLSAVLPSTRPPNGINTAMVKSAFAAASKSPSQCLSQEVQCVAYNDASIRLTVDDEFSHVISGVHSASQSFLHCAHRQSSFHAVLQTQATQPKGSRAEAQSPPVLTFIQLPFTASSCPHTATIFARTSQLKGLSLLLRVHIEHLLSEWKSNINLPTRFVSNVDVTLSEKGESKLQIQLFTLAMTGHTSSTVTEWLKDELREAGHKRWDAAMTALYAAVAQSCRMYILPALERCTLAASSLRGLATFYRGSKTFDVDPQVFTIVIQAVSCVVLLVHECMQIVGVEERQYRAFSKWMRRQIALAGAEPGSAGALELAEAEAMTTDIASVLDYIEGPLASSGLLPFLTADATANAQIADKECIENITSSIHATRKGEHVTLSLSIPYWMNVLSRALQTASDSINAWQSSTWQPPTSTTISVSPHAQVLDMTMSIMSGEKSTTCVEIVALEQGEQNRIVTNKIYKSATAHNTVSSDGIQQQQHDLVLDPCIQLRDLKVLCNGTKLALVEDNDVYQLIRLEGVSEARVQQYSSQGSQEVLHSFDANDEFLPMHLYVSEREHKQSVLVLDEQRCRWHILDLSTTSR